VIQHKFGLILSILVLAVTHFSRYILNIPLTDFVFRPDSHNAIHFFTAFFTHSGHNHFCVNLIGFILLTIFSTSKTIDIWIAFIVCGWLANLFGVFCGEYLVVGFSGGLMALAANNIIQYKFQNKKVIFISSLYTLMAIIMYLLNTPGTAHYVHLGGFVSGCIHGLVTNRIKTIRLNQKENQETT
jgi:membrane associated rhomboid family serine protease